MNASLKLPLSALIALALATPALAQDSRKPTSSGSSTGSSATPRGGSSAGSGSTTSSGSGSSSSGSSTASSGGESRRSPSTSRPEREPQSSVRRPSGQAAGAGPDVPAYSRPRNGAPVRGTAVDRGNNPLPPRGGFPGSYYYPGYYDYNYYGSPYRFAYFPVYTGFGHFYYDPYWGYYSPGYAHGYGYSGGYSRRSKDDRDYGIGSLRLKIDPEHGEVYVDGLYRGVVNDFDGVFQRLKLEAGAHRLEVRAPGFRTLVFDVLVTPGETTTYRGDLKRQ